MVSDDSSSTARNEAPPVTNRAGSWVTALVAAPDSMSQDHTPAAVSPRIAGAATAARTLCRIVSLCSVKYPPTGYRFRR